MKVIKNKLSDVGRAPCSVDNLNDLPFIPKDPLPKKNFCMYIVGSPGSGKTNLTLSLMLSHPTKKNKNKNRYFYGLFDSIWLISGSIGTLPEKFLKQIDEDKQFGEFSDELIEDIIQTLYDGKNQNNLIIMDDCIRDLSNSKILSKLLLNRRHISHNPDREDDDGQGSVSIMITSQKFSLLPLSFRVACSDFALFKSTNKTEINRIGDEVCYDLSSDDYEELLKTVWAKKYDFMFLRPNENIDKKYYKNFDAIEF